MSQDMLKVRVVINQGGENQSDLEAPLKPVSGVEQAQVMRALQSGKMNETSDSYAVEEKYTYNYSRIFGAFFLMVAFFVVATSYFVGRIPSRTLTENTPQQTALPTESQTEFSTPAQSVTPTQSAAPTQSVTPESTEQVTAIPPTLSEAVTSIIPLPALQSADIVEKVEEKTVQETTVSAPVAFLATAQSSVSATQSAKIANISNVEARILDPRLAMNPTFLGSMIKKEPGIPLASQIPFDENNLIRVFFYLETKNLKGKWLRQHWYYQGKKMATVTSFVNANAFKTHSSKFIRHNWVGAWQVVVSVVDQPNQPENKEKKLAEGSFGMRM